MASSIRFWEATITHDICTRWALERCVSWSGQRFPGRFYLCISSARKTYAMLWPVRAGLQGYLACKPLFPDSLPDALPLCMSSLGHRFLLERAAASVDGIFWAYCATSVITIPTAFCVFTQVYATSASRTETYQEKCFQDCFSTPESFCMNSKDIARSKSPRSSSSAPHM